MVNHQHNDDMFDDTTRPTSRKAQNRLARREQREQKYHFGYQPLVPLNESQKYFMDALHDSNQVFAVGPAGTGKTYIAARHAIRLVADGKKEKVYVSRATAAKKKHVLGFRPGKQVDKIADWMIPIMDGFKAEVSSAQLQQLIRDERVEFVPFETMRGRSLANSIAILDEAQNCDIGDLKMFLTRIGEHTQVIVCGDPDQVDIDDSGLEHVVDMIDKFNITAEIAEFDETDVVRSGIAKEWVIAFGRS